MPNAQNASAKLLGHLRSAVLQASTGGRARNSDRDFLDRLAAVFSQCRDVEQQDIVRLTGLSKGRIQAARKNPVQKHPKKRSDAATAEDFRIITDWVIRNARRSADKTNTAMHPTQGLHHVFYRTWTEAEGHQRFKSDCPGFKFKKTTFDQHVRSLFWLKKPRNSNCLCTVCTNHQLLLQGLKTHQKGVLFFTFTRTPLEARSATKPPSANASCDTPQCI